MSAAADPALVPPAPLGEWWAWALCMTLLAGLGVLTAARWLVPASSHETVVQQAIGPTDFPPARPEATAPDPGDDL